MSASTSEISPPAAKTTLLAPGDVVDGRYRIESFLGGGGMASVYLATHVVLEQRVAIKVISSLIREVPGMAQRFLREARAATHLKSEHVARVTDVGTMPDGSPYMVMEYLEGRDLDSVVESEEEVTVEDAVDYVLQACEALAEVHGLGIVHRDLKPANLFLTQGADGLPCVKLIDFGISRTDSPLSPNDLAGLTQPDTVLGSPRYMSPESMESATKADSRSDIYGIGVVLYELLTKNAPHDGETFLDIYAAATLGPPIAPSSVRPDVPHALDEVILRCLRIDPAERYVDAASLAAALAPFGPPGSPARAEAIARILEAARSRTRDAGVSSEDAVLHGGESSASSSKVRRRASGSAHTVRRRRIVRAAIVFAVLAFAGLVVGGRALYSSGQANGIASSEATSALAVASPPTVTAPTVATVPLNVVETAAAPSTVTVATATAAPPTAANSPVLPARVPPATPQAAFTPSPPSYQPPAPPAAAPSTEERKLFEDRK